MSTPTRCVDPIMKYCQGCRYGHITYPAWVETYQDTEDCTFDVHCSLGYDNDRPEDEPTVEEIKEFVEWWNSAYPNQQYLDVNDYIRRTSIKDECT